MLSLARRFMLGENGLTSTMTDYQGPPMMILKLLAGCALVCAGLFMWYGSYLMLDYGRAAVEGLVGFFLLLLGCALFVGSFGCFDDD